ncbi:hypothetical protein Lfu02_24660 [Longispora fulva]|uniref:2'-5' RNA ligase n=1 Tax=Longispora fulva TaxID=619741 RepID=A0A8J7GMD6_9ACTN|nr:hypothetical protein [Longispora fulva]MBG6139523.1 hypothetical protein [Longispora fulva]GIG58094.1 hypothetical protein Lfu02_24660 [Longispora fulva]
MTLFDDLYEKGRTAVLAGQHYTETPPVDGGPAWGLSVVVRPSPTLAARMAAVAAEALTLAGPGHWPTGNAHSSHFTLRCLETYRTGVPASDPMVGRVGDALRKAVVGLRPFRLEVTGLTLTPGSVMACAEADGDTAELLKDRLGEALGADGHYEAGFRRAIWYANLVHFAAPIAEPACLVDWVGERRRLHLGEVLITEVELLRWDDDGSQMVPAVFEAVPLS